MRNKVLPFTVIILSCLLLNCNLSTNSGRKSVFYINTENGNDNNSGTTQSKAWKTLNRANQNIFKAGDELYLTANQTFNGTLRLSGSKGKSDQRIKVSSFGNGRAIIESADSDAIVAENCSYLDIKNLIVKGSGRLKGNKTSGITLITSQFCTIDSIEASGYLWNGINIEGGHNISIKHTKVYDNGFCGILVNLDKNNKISKSVKNIYIGYCIAENNPGCPVIKDNHSGNGILIGNVTTGLIEHCEAMNNGWDMPREGNGPVGIWAYESDSITIQNCYAHDNKTSPKGRDGGGFDFDGGITNSIMQYNLSANNEGGGYGLFQYSGASEWKNNIIRYNISINDGKKNSQAGIHIWCDVSSPIPLANCHIYNNTIVNNHVYGIFFEPGTYNHFVFENNIFLITTNTKSFTGGKFSEPVFDNNLYWSRYSRQHTLPQPNVIADKHAVIKDAMLTLSDSIENLLSDNLQPQTLQFLKLQSNSAALKTGKVIKNNGSRDFWGNRLIENGFPDIGAYQLSK